MKKKKIKRQWTFEDVKVVLSNPKIQAFDSYVYLNDIKGIFHYYYDLKAYVKSKKKWTLLFQTFVYDFPCIQYLPLLIEDLSVERPYFSTESFACEDYYSISRVSTTCDGSDYLWYDLTIGVGQEQGNMHQYLHSIKLLRLSEEDLLSFKQFIQDFLNDSLFSFNQQQEEYITQNKHRYFVNGGKLYERGDKKDSLFSMYHKDSTFDITVLYEDAEDKYQSVYVEYQSARLLDTTQDAILIVFRYADCLSLVPEDVTIQDNQVWIPLCQIQHVFDYFSEDSEILGYDKQQSYEYIKSLFYESELKEFGRRTAEENTKKWQNIFENLIWAYREEHKFQNPKRTVRWMIKKLTLEMLDEDVSENDDTDR